MDVTQSKEEIRKELIRRLEELDLDDSALYEYVDGSPFPELTFLDPDGIEYEDDSYIAAFRYKGVLFGIGGSYNSWAGMEYDCLNEITEVVKKSFTKYYYEPVEPF